MISFKLEIDEQELLKLIDEKLDKIAEDVFFNSQQIIVQKNIIDEGTLLKTGNINKSFLEKVITYPVPYADQIEFGRLPGEMPPEKDIKEWVKRKKIATEEPKLSRITWTIMKNIEEDGLEPRPFLSPAVEMVKNKLRS